MQFSKKWSGRHGSSTEVMEKKRAMEWRRRRVDPWSSCFFSNSPQNKKKLKKMQTYKAGVQDYRLTYFTPDYVPSETDILATFRVTPQPGVPIEECAAAVAAESSTGTWTTVWTDGLTDLNKYKGRCFGFEQIPGSEPMAAMVNIAYPLDLFEEGSVTNLITSIVGNVFGFKALSALRLEIFVFHLLMLKLSKDHLMVFKWNGIN